MSATSAAKTSTHQRWPGVIAAYRDRLPVGDDWVPVTLFEGGTPLVPAPRLSAQIGCMVEDKLDVALRHAARVVEQHDQRSPRQARAEQLLRGVGHVDDRLREQLGADFGVTDDRR